MAVIYILVIIAKSPFIIGRYLLTNRLLLAVVIIAIVGAVFMNRMTASSGGPVPDYITAAPDTPKAVQTSTRIYYLNSYLDAGDYYILTDFYEYDGGEWVQRLIPNPIDKDRARIINR